MDDHFEQEITVYTEITVKLILKASVLWGEERTTGYYFWLDFKKQNCKEEQFGSLTVGVRHSWGFKKTCLIHCQKTSLGHVCVTLVGINALWVFWFTCFCSTEGQKMFILISCSRSYLKCTKSPKPHKTLTRKVCFWMCSSCSWSTCSVLGVNKEQSSLFTKEEGLSIQVKAKF